MIRQSDEPGSFSTLRELVCPFSPGHLLSAIAGLQLIPTNADQLLRLEALAEVIATVSETEAGAANASRHRVGQLCSAVPMIFSEDPCETPFTDNISFFGGSFIVFPGGGPGGVSRVENLLRAIFWNVADEDLPGGFLSPAHDSVLALLAISDLTARRAGLDRHVAPVTRPGATVDVPASANIEEVRHSTIWTQTEVAALLVQLGLNDGALEPFITDCGTEQINNIAEQGRIFDRHPLVRVGDDLIVAAPGRIVTALPEALLDMAATTGVLDRVASRFGTSCWRDVAHSLRLLGHQRLKPKLQDAPSKGFYEGFFSLDLDSALFVQLAFDPLDDFGESRGMWKDKSIPETFEKRSAQADAMLSKQNPSPREVLHLYILASPGRSYVTGVGGSKSLTLLLQPDELAAIADVESGDELALLRYARASGDLRDSCRVLAFSQLDEYQMFRSHGYSYYISDDRRPTHLSIMPGTGLQLRLDAHNRRDWHSVLSPTGDGHIEVTCLSDDREIPLYVPLSQAGWSICVESLPRLVWVVAIGAQAKRHHLQPELIETVAYWIWQAGAALAPSLRDADRNLNVWVELVEPDSWLAKETNEATNEENAAGDSVLCQPTDDGEFAISLKLHRDFLTSLDGPDNDGERHLLKHLLLGYAEVCGRFGLTALSERDVEQALDQYAPLGPKKKMILLNQAINPDVNSTGLPRYRKIHPFDDGVILDEVGSYLSSLRDPGPIPDTERVTSLNSLVSYLYGELEHEVGRFKAEPLLAWLIAQHEAIANTVALQRLTIPTRIACYALQDKIVEELQRELPEANRASVASRFLIEYVAARQPSGKELPSYGSYQRLIALSAAIIAFGTDSDAIQYQIGDMKLAVLESGRIGISRGAYQAATDAFGTSTSQAEVRHAGASFRDHWRDISGADSNEKDDVNQAFDAEFGHSLTDHALFIAELLNLGWTVDTPQKRFGVDAVTQHMMKELGWSELKTQTLIGSLSLAEREDFLKPPSPASREDVYPWRFNRAFSYVRRPLISWQSGGAQELWWGNRHVWVSGRNLVALFESGRLKANSMEMKRLVGKYRERHGRTFNDQVAASIEPNDYTLVRKRVKKIGGLRIGAPDEDLGDIDVLALSPKGNRVLLVECKALNIARTPWEFASELDTLFRGSGGKDSVVDRHRRRMTWIESHAAETSDLFGISARRFHVDGVVVVDEESFAAHLLSKTDLPVVSLHRFESSWLPHWLSR